MTSRAFVMASNGAPGSDIELRYAEADGDDIARILRSPQCEFEVTVAEPTLRKYEVMERLERLIQSCERTDTFLFYFAGHGILEKGKLLLVWEKRNVGVDLRDVSLPVSFIRELIEHCPAYNRLVILDCCHAGAAAGVRDVPTGAIEDAVGRNPENYLILCAGERLEPTRELEEFGGSFLKKGILEALGDRFLEADADQDQRLSYDDLREWLNRSWDRLEPRQRVLIPRPHSIGQQSGSLYLTSERTTWTPLEVPWANTSSMVVMPFAPINGRVLCIGKHPVTNGQYRQFVEDAGWPEPEGEFLPDGTSGDDPANWQRGFRPWKDSAFNQPEQPVVCVSWRDAIAYCDWVNERSTSQSEFAGHTYLATKRQWHYAAFRTEDPQPATPEYWLSRTREVHHRSGSPAPVDHIGPRWNTWGISDLIGNVWEWCSDTFAITASGYISHYTAYRDLTYETPEEFERFIVSRSRTERYTEIGYRGGGFVDDLAVTPPFLDPHEVDKDVKHFDLGFRAAGVFSESALPRDSRIRLDFQEPASRYLKASLMTVLLYHGDEEP